MANDAKIEIVLAAKDAATQASGRAMDTIKSQVSDLERRAAQFARNWLQVTAAIYATGKAWDEIKMGARIQQERQAFENMAKSYGQNADMIISKLKEASAGTIDTMTLINKAGTAMMMGIAPENISKLMEIARSTSRMTGQTISQAFSDIALAVGRQSKMILDNLGIIVSVEKAGEAYAQVLKKTASQLTDAEKKQAFLNATIAEGDKLIKRLGDTQRRTAAEMFQSWEALARNVRSAMSEGMVTALKYVVTAFTLAGSSINQIFEQIAQGWSYIFGFLGKMPGGELLGFKALGDSLQGIADQLRGARMEAYKFADELMSLKPPPYVMPGMTVQGPAAPGGAKDDASEYNRLLREADRLQQEAIASLRVLQTQGVGTWERMNEWLERNNQAEEQAIALARQWNEEAMRSLGIEAPNMAQRLEEALGDPDAYFGKMTEGAEKMSESIKNAVTGWASGFAKTLSDLVWGSKTSFTDIARSFGMMLTEMAMQKMIIGPLLRGFESWFGSFFGSAKGNVFLGGVPQPYARGGIIDRPTIFPMARGGLGLAGEAGDEAIFPITRLPGGDLGIKGTGNSPPAVTVVVNNNTGQNARVRQDAPKWNGQEWILSVWLDAYQRNVGGLREAIGR